MRRFALFAWLAVAGGALMGASANASTICVGGGSGCFATIQDAVDAAGNGDRILIAPGTYDGGVTIDVSIRLIGAGADQTVIRGGGPVLTIGTFGAASEPKVSITGVRITGGITRSSPESVPFTGEEGVFAAGGGIEIPPNDDFSGGATVTVRDSVINDNLVAPEKALPVGPPCPNGPCPFAQAEGGGIDSWGTLKLVDTIVRDNRVGSASGLSNLASDTVGGGIVSRLGPAILVRARVAGNQATADAPNGRFVEGAGMFVDGRALVLRSSSVTANEGSLASSLPSSVEQLAVGGGIQIGGAVATARIDGTTISANAIGATNSVGDAVAFSGGFNTAEPEINLRTTDSTIARNEVSAAALNPSQGDAEGDTGGAPLSGTVRRTQITDNTVDVRSAAGDATAAAGGSLASGLIIDGQAVGNSVHAESPSGNALAAGGAIVVDSGLTLLRTTVRANTTTATGQSGASQGGGIFDASLFSDGGPLTLIDSIVLQNVATGGPLITVQGGGLYVQDNRARLIRSSLEDNVPDECFGC